MGFNEELLLQKKARFLAAVNRAASTLGVVPTVHFWDCPNKTENEWAHIHRHTAEICVSEVRLEQMTFDKIEETAVHEVTHLSDTCDECNERHSPGFYGRMADNSASQWRPPGGGVVLIRENNNLVSIAKTDPKVYEPNPEECHYHLCRKKGETTECRYCGHFFCHEHLSPSLPFVGSPWSNSPEARLALLKQKNTHPCIAFAKFEENKAETKHKQYEAALQGLSTETRVAAPNLVKHTNNKLTSSSKNTFVEQDVTESFESRKKDKVHKTLISKRFSRNAKGFLPNMLMKIKNILAPTPCFFGNHHYVKVGGPSHVGNGVFRQKGRCLRCGKTTNSES